MGRISHCHCEHYGDGNNDLFLTKSDDKVYFVYLDNGIYFCSEDDAADMAGAIYISRGTLL
jgi:hypothetical protein